MTNFEYIKSLDYDDILQIFIQKITCSDCPALKKCRYNSLDCCTNIKIWLDEEYKND